MSFAQGSCAVAASSPENYSNNNMAADGNVNVKNVVQTIV